MRKFRFFTHELNGDIRTLATVTFEDGEVFWNGYEKDVNLVIGILSEPHIGFSDNQREFADFDPTSGEHWTRALSEFQGVAFWMMELKLKNDK